MPRVPRRRRDRPAQPRWLAEFRDECVVGGARLSAERLEVLSLLLALYDDDGGLEHIGVVSSFAKAIRWRPDREPRLCRIGQLDEPIPDADRLHAG